MGRECAKVEKSASETHLFGPSQVKSGVEREAEKLSKYRIRKRNNKIRNTTTAVKEKKHSQTSRKSKNVKTYKKYKKKCVHKIKNEA